MKPMTLKGWSSALCLSAALVQAQETNEIERVQQEIQQANESFERAVQEHRRAMDELNRRLESIRQRQAGLTNGPAAPPANEPRASEPVPPTVKSESPPAKPWSPADPLRLGGRGQNYLNLALDALFAAGSSTADDLDRLQLGGHDPNQRGFTVQNVELMLDGAVDPYFRGQANATLFTTSAGETEIELEEAFAETLSLPANLQIRGGLYLTEFGRHNPTHPHAWGFVDTPLVNGRFLGPDGLRNPGARVSWLAPTPFYSELMLSVQNSQGETAASFRSQGGHAHGDEAEEDELPLAYRHADNDRGVRNFGDLLFSPRAALSFDLTDSQVLLLGASGAFGPNSRGGEDGGGGGTQIYGLDFTWKWKPTTHAGGFPFVAWQTEAMVRRYEVGAFDWSGENPDFIDLATGLPAVLPRETLTDYGFYTQLLYGFRQRWVAGLRFDYVTGKRGDYERLNLQLNGEDVGRDPLRAERWRLSPNLTWHPTEFSKIRLQYNYDDRKDIGADHSVWLQFEFVLGAHAAHKF